MKKFVNDAEYFHIDSLTASHHFKLNFLLSKFLSECEHIQNHESICSHLLNRNLKANVIQWNLYKADTIRSKKSVRFMEMSAL